MEQNRKRNRNIVLSLLALLLICSCCWIVFSLGLIKVDFKALSNETQCYFAGGRQTDGLVPGHSTIEYAGTCDYSAFKNGVSLQAYWEELVSLNTNLPEGINVDSVKPLKLELVNDGIQVFALGKSAETLKFYVLSREDSDVPFYSASCVEITDSGDFLVYKDDVGGPGGFDGACSGNSETISGYSSSRLGNPELYRYIESIYWLAQKGYEKPAQPLQVDIIWFK